ncbi:MAG: UvrD-helicase domain-containing protein [Acidimicrobiia bacterium]
MSAPAAPSTVSAFDVCGPLPTGVTVLEASAGTGKTFTIAALAARYVAAGVPLGRLLVVTFTRMATSELQNRVRERLVSAEGGLARALAGAEPDPDDDVVCLLAEGTTAEVQTRRVLLARALSDYDAATITTIHGFCQHALDGFGLAGDLEAGVTFTEDVSDLVDEVVDDLYVRKFAGRQVAGRFDRAEAGRIGRLAVENPGAPIEPADAEAGSGFALRRGLAMAVRAEVDRRKRTRGLLTYDDQLTRLRDTLADESGGDAASARLRQRWRVALVDEFQDTDPVQWEIMRRAFAHPDSTLVLIGDPKQAIYAFRGADVYAYLEAARAGTAATLDVNWRSDQGLIDAYDALLRGTRLGHEGIAYRKVRAADAHQKPRLTGAPASAALRFRMVQRADGLVRTTNYGYVQAASGRAHIAADLAAEAVALLASGAVVETRGRDGSVCAREQIRPGHLAVLVRRNRDGATVRDALAAAGVPAVINGAGSVFDTPVARQWLRLLEALERPTSPARAHSAALTAFFGWTTQQVAGGDEDAWEAVHVTLHRWAGLLRRRGVASLLEAITWGEGLPGRVLTGADGERELTDLRHVAQLLHAEATAGGLGAAALAGWLRQRIAEAGEDTHNEDRSRRLESDAQAVQVLTIHRAKGLEFPVVYCPYLWEPGYMSKRPLPFFHDPGAGDRRTIDVGGDGSPGYDAHLRQFVAEQRGEDLRLAYVALTRARHQAVVWWAGSYDSRDSPLGRLLFCRGPDGSVGHRGKETPADDKVIGRLSAVADYARGQISVERTGPQGAKVWTAGGREPGELVAARFGRRLDEHWRRTSYSAIVHAAHEAAVASEPEEELVADEPAVAAPEVVEADESDGPLRAVVSPLADMPAGADVGTFVHAVLEHTDFTSEELEGELAGRVAAELARRPVDIGDPAVVSAGLRASVRTPLGSLLDERRLADIGAADRLDELHFELPLVGGDHPNAALAVRAVAQAMSAHLPPDDPLAAYPSRLAAAGLAGELRGYLSGSLDMVLRVRGNSGIPRFAVVDHKTNWLGADGEPLSAWHYRPAALAEAMMRAHYPLQAVLYAVALHRYLRWRLPGYTPDANLAGVLYLFLRGMCGPDTPRVGGQPCGVFAWRPSPALVEAVSDVLDLGVATR